MSNAKHDYSYMQNRELSWLDFNKRVLDQSADPTVPLFERLNFLSIFWSNLQEFFMIRVGSLTDLALLKKEIVDSKSGMTPSEQLDAIHERCHELYPYYEQCYKNIRKELSHKGILNIRNKDLASDQLSYVDEYFEANIMPFLSPQIVNSRHPFPHLENGALYVVVRLDEEAAKHKDKKKGKTDPEVSHSDQTSKSEKGDKQGKSSKNVAAEGVTLGIIPMPKQCPRIIRIPGQGFQFMLLEHLIERFVDRIFSMYKVKHTNVICVTRNADLDATEGAEEQGEDYREHIKKILKKRMRLAPVRLESERELSTTVKKMLLGRLNLKSHQTFVSSVPLDLSYVFEIPQLVTPELRKELSVEPFTPQWPSSLDRNRSLIEQVSEHDILLSYPYESMDAFIQLLREAAVDPDVVAIKITLYRLAKQSHVAEALINAAENGKEVTAVFELRARFDEANNIEWSQRFEAAGCNVLYGFRDYKVHSKVCLIVRRKGEGHQLITQLGTGNYNEKTAKLYTDFSFITTDKRIGRDVAAFFRNMTLENLSDEYHSIWVAPLQIKQNICSKIDKQIINARAGKPAALFFKTNSITDKDVIDKIVEASRAGVQCTLFVRGISCIVPGIPDYTENVCVVSIVGRLLEHSRIYVFGPFDGDCEIYLSSADLMTRNMDKRVEIAWSITDDAIRERIVGYIGTCMADTAKLRDLLPNHRYTDLGFFARRDNTGRRRLFDSQNYLIHEAERNLFEDSEGMHAAQIANIRELRTSALDELDLSDMGEEAGEFEDIVEGIYARTRKSRGVSARRETSRARGVYDSRRDKGDVVRDWANANGTNEDGSSKANPDEGIKVIRQSTHAIEDELNRESHMARAAVIAGGDIEERARRDSFAEVMPWKGSVEADGSDAGVESEASFETMVEPDPSFTHKAEAHVGQIDAEQIDAGVSLEPASDVEPEIDSEIGSEIEPEIEPVAELGSQADSHIQSDVDEFEAKGNGESNNDIDIDDLLVGMHSNIPNISNLYTPEPNPDGVFEIPVMSGGKFGGVSRVKRAEEPVVSLDLDDGIDEGLNEGMNEDVELQASDNLDNPDNSDNPEDPEDRDGITGEDIYSEQDAYLEEAGNEGFDASHRHEPQDVIDQYADSLVQDRLNNEFSPYDDSQVAEGSYYQGYGTNGDIDQGFGSSDDASWVNYAQNEGVDGSVSDHMDDGYDYVQQDMQADAYQGDANEMYANDAYEYEGMPSAESFAQPEQSVQAELIEEVTQQAPQSEPFTETFIQSDQIAGSTEQPEPYAEPTDQSDSSAYPETYFSQAYNVMPSSSDIYDSANAPTTSVTSATSTTSTIYADQDAYQGTYNQGAYDLGYSQADYDPSVSDSISMSSQFGFGEYIDEVQPQSQVQIQPAVESEEETCVTDERGLGSEWKGPDGAVPADEIFWPEKVNAALSGRFSHDLSGLDVSTSGELPGSGELSAVEAGQPSGRMVNPEQALIESGDNAPMGNSVNLANQENWQAAIPDVAYQQEVVDMQGVQPNAIYESNQFPSLGQQVYDNGQYGSYSSLSSEQMSQLPNVQLFQNEQMAEEGIFGFGPMGEPIRQMEDGRLAYQSAEGQLIVQSGNGEWQMQGTLQEQMAGQDQGQPQGQPSEQIQVPAQNQASSQAQNPMPIQTQDQAQNQTQGQAQGPMQDSAQGMPEEKQKKKGFFKRLFS